MLCFFRKSLPFRRDRGFSLPEILVVIGILGVLAAIAIPVSMSQQSRASDASIRSDLTNVAAVVEGQLLAWRGAPPDGALNICSGISGEYPPVNDPTNTCEEGQWRATRVSNNQVLSPPVEGKLSPGIFVQGRIASDGSYCLDGSSSRSGAKNFYFDSQSSQVQEGTCKSISWTPTGSLVGSTGATTTPGDLPSPPSGVAVEVPEGGSTATVKWNAQAGVTYIVKVSNEPAKTLTASTTGVVSCVFPAETCEGSATGNLMVGTYTAIVRAGNSEGWGAGATQDFKIENAGGMDVNLLSAPTITNAERSGDDSVLLSWTNASSVPIDGYRVRWSTDEGESWNSSIATGSTKKSFVVQNIAPGFSYIFQVQSIALSGLGGQFSAPSSIVNMPVIPPTSPLELEGFSDAPNTVKLSWKNPEKNGGGEITNYVVNISPNAGSVSFTGNRAVATGLTNGIEYEFKVAAVNSAGQGEWSTTILITPYGAPSIPISTAVSTWVQEATITWGKPANDGGKPIESYYIQYKKNSDSFWTWVSLDAVGEGPFTYKLSNLTSDISYNFRVAATNEKGTGTWSAILSGVPLHTHNRATGGSVADFLSTGQQNTISGQKYRVHTFNSSGTFSVSNAVKNFRVLLVAGGGGGNGGPAGGGGGGGMIEQEVTLTQGNYTVTVGQGGASGVSGGNSVFSTLTALGGGRSGVSGGSGGGNFSWGSGGAGAAGTSGQGNNGGAAASTSAIYSAGGGGGGTGGAGGNASGCRGGNGGAGRTTFITGTSRIFAGGGGGGTYFQDCNSPGGSGGSGGGGRGGGSQGGNGVAGTANTGGGGGGGGATNGSSRAGSSGGSGIVIIRYEIE
jgi:prepilin-type N-terminal cleavage/methylation domain-containing protein